MWNWLRKIYHRLVRRPAAAEPANEPAEVAPVTPLPRQARKKPQQDERPGSFLHLNDILKQISTCRKLLVELRKFDREAYDYHARLGARLVPQGGGAFLKSADQFRKLLPAAGMVLIMHDDEEYPPHLLYFSKLTRNQPHIAVPNTDCTLYRMSVVTMLDGGAYGYRYVIALQDDRPRIVAERLDRVQRLPKRVRAVIDGRKVRVKEYVHTFDWGIPEGLTYHWRANERASRDFKSPIDYGLWIFDTASAFFDATTEEFQVRAEQHGVSVAFSVGLDRTPYFFKDREGEVTESGRKRKIFHAVEAHERTLRDGRVTTVTAHYRGLRRFKWHDEEITITPPEYAAKLIDVHADEIDLERPVPEGYMPTAEAGGMMVEVLERDRRISKHDPPRGLAARR